MTISTRSARMRGAPVVVAVVLTLGAVLVPASASAQACCTATGAGEFSVVGRCQDAVLATQLSFQRGTGTFTDDGDYRSLDHARVNDMVVSLGGGFRPFSKRFQVHGSLPLRVQHRSFESTGDQVSLGPGDAAAGMRWTALQDRMSGISMDDASSLVPFLDFYAGMKVPTGRAPEETTVATGADITGDGAWQFLAGAKLSKFLTTKHVLGLQAAYSHSLARQIEHSTGGATTDFARGGQVDVSASYLHIHDLFWSWGLNSSYSTTAQAHADGTPVPDSQARRLRFGAHITHGFEFPYWEATLSVTADAWWDGPSENQPFVGPSAALTLRRQFL